jgi:hypothetical protein
VFKDNTHSHEKVGRNSDASSRHEIPRSKENEIPT